MTEDERGERIEATAFRMIAELLERAAVRGRHRRCRGRRRRQLRLGVCAAGDLRHATGRQPHDPSPVSGRLRRSAGRDRFSVVGEQMANFGRCWHAGHGR